MDVKLAGIFAGILAFCICVSSGMSVLAADSSALPGNFEASPAGIRIAGIVIGMDKEVVSGRLRVEGWEEFDGDGVFLRQSERLAVVFEAGRLVEVTLFRPFVGDRESAALYCSRLLDEKQVFTQESEVACGIGEADARSGQLISYSFRAEEVDGTWNATEKLAVVEGVFTVTGGE